MLIKRQNLMTTLTVKLPISTQGFLITAAVWNAKPDVDSSHKIEDIFKKPIGHIFSLL